MLPVTKCGSTHVSLFATPQPLFLVCCNQLLSSLSNRRCAQRSVSGNQKSGCDAIIVGDRGRADMSTDTFHTLTYTATTMQGARSMLRSMRSGRAVRVFRSSNATHSTYRPLLSRRGSARYRYDGLYDVAGINPDVSVLVKDVIYTFQFVRRSTGNRPGLNALSVSVLIQNCIRRHSIVREAGLSP